METKERKEDDAGRGTRKYCVSCDDEFFTPTGKARLCENCRTHNTIASSEERLQDAYRRGIIPQLENDPNDEDFLEIDDDERYSEDDIQEMFGQEDEWDDDCEDDWE